MQIQSSKRIFVKRCQVSENKESMFYALFKVNNCQVILRIYHQVKYRWIKYDYGLSTSTQSYFGGSTTPFLMVPYPISLNFLSILLLKATFSPIFVQMGLFNLIFIISCVKTHIHRRPGSPCQEFRSIPRWISKTNLALFWLSSEVFCLHPWS